MPLASGTRLGSYEILSPLGEGSMGAVYLARDLRLGREVALKVLPPDLATRPDQLARLEREARAVASLNHPNIVVLHSVEDAGSTRFLTMEHVVGETLDQLIAPAGWPVERVVDLGVALAEALAAAHDKGVIHRDLKPANVMITKTRHVKVLDFGLAKLEAEYEAPIATRAPTAPPPLSTAGQVVGTVPYMAPEQLRGEEVDGRTDLFALGVVLYEATCGHRPFDGRTFAEVSSAILRDEPVPLAQARPGVPAELDRLVDRCLRKPPLARFQTAREVADALRRLKHALEHGEPGARFGAARERLASVAVLPFVNRSASAEDEYFSDGLADELLNLLSKIRGLRVAARASSFQFRGTREDLGTIGAKLNVATVLEGSVRKSGPRVRISVQLVRIADAAPLWSETYDRGLDDIFAVQDEIAQSVVQELRTTLLGHGPELEASREVRAEVAKAARGRGTDPEAHRLYLQARYLIDRRTRDETLKGVEYLERALSRSPDFALAFAVLAQAYSRSADVGWLPLEEGYSRARLAVERALELEPDLAEAHAQLGWIRMIHDWDWRRAEASYRRALELAPGNSQALHGAGALAYNEGRLDEAIDFCRRALEQDPLNAGSYHNLGGMLRLTNLAEAEEAYRKALELAPQRIATRAALALVLVARGRGEEALSMARSEPNAGFRQWSLAIVYQALGLSDDSREALSALIAMDASVWALQIAEAHAMRDETDEAFEWLERAYQNRDGGLTEMKVSDRLRALRSDPRWGTFLARMGFEP